jgi:hypothetical protein
MAPLTLDDLLPLEEYVCRRREFFESLGRYLDRYRRVRIGPNVTLIFENRQTLWFRVHEIIRIARLSESARLQKELDLYNSLLPNGQTLQAALLIDISNEMQIQQELAAWRDFNGSQLSLRYGTCAIWATLVTCRPEDLAVGAAHWVQFLLDATARQHLANLREPAHLEIDLPGYKHQSAQLSDEIRQSLVEDLQATEKAG